MKAAVLIDSAHQIKIMRNMNIKVYSYKRRLAKSKNVVDFILSLIKGRVTCNLICFDFKLFLYQSIVRKCISFL